MGTQGKAGQSGDDRFSEALGAGIWGGSGFQVETPGHQGAVKLALESIWGGAPPQAPAGAPASLAGGPGPGAVLLFPDPSRISGHSQLNSLRSTSFFFLRVFLMAGSSLPPLPPTSSSPKLCWVLSFTFDHYHLRWVLQSYPFHRWKS